MGGSPTMRRESSVLSRTTCSLEELWCPCTELSTLSTLAQTASTDPLSTWYVRRRSPTSHVRPMVFLRQLLYLRSPANGETALPREPDRTLPLCFVAALYRDCRETLSMCPRRHERPATSKILPRMTSDETTEKAKRSNVANGCQNKSATSGIAGIDVGEAAGSTTG